MERRKFTQIVAMMGMASLFGGATSSCASQQSTHVSEEKQHADAMAQYSDLSGGEHLIIGMLVYPEMYLLDFVGPLSVFESLMNREIHLIWKNSEPISSTSSHIQITPTTTFENCPEHLDVLFVPGGVPGTFTMMEDLEVLSFLATKGKTARYISSVCTGSLILGSAGLLNGYRATSYWSLKDVLSEFGAIVCDERVVVDRNRITGGGVTAGIDLALTITERLRNQTYAKAIQLYLEYDPAPPFNSGSPEKAPKVVKKFLLDMFQGMHEKALTIAKKKVRV
ncbi:MAG: DJ-1/PfpI family protein [Sulfuricurvum sp.]|uniref:DJ-1/PfpI family protein n=1 Tax=Sulfuricurvum sp. TaxID=2025608 RepID=UPI0026169D2F|nr:DJ-1/PfpI family protein [Sulfuricurvum sp.]MDD2828100.1 DJ-1/PfpI family protein [Sulfuricurvum sp.]MDD4948026.1 DJ-1/PfpI family protein [Sulfuricurvum sp.]